MHAYIRFYTRLCINSLIHSRHRMLNLMWKLLEIISCCNIVFTWPRVNIDRRFFTKNRKVARRENRWTAFESNSIRISSIFASSRKRFSNERGEEGDGPTMVPTLEISDVISNPFLRYFINVASDVSTKE